MQVEVIRTYTAKQPDELSLQVADVVLVSQIVEDGTFALDYPCRGPLMSPLPVLCPLHFLFLVLTWS